MADCLDEIAGTRSNISCEVVGAVVCVARFVERYELFEVVEQTLFMLSEEGVWILRRRNLVLVL